MLYLIGDSRRRSEAIPLIKAKFRGNLARRYTPEKQAAIIEIFADPEHLEPMAIDDRMELLAA